jgi:hypothetical protein
MVCDQLAKIQQTDDLFAAPFRDDGTTHGTANVPVRRRPTHGALAIHKARL